MMKKYLLLTFLFIGFYAQAQEKINLVLNVFNEFTNDNISFADIKMINNTTNQRVFKKTNFNGNISIDLFPNMSYKLTVTSVSDSNIVVFKEKSLDFDTKGIQAGTNIEYNVKLRPVFQKGGLQFIQDLQFNIFKYTLNKENEIILENVLELLQKHPEINLEVNAYAACNLSEDDANSVSVERAKAVVFYLTGKGIDYQRIKAAAWGKEQSITKCTCKPQKPKDKECSKRELLKNSRVNLKFTGV
ncbi:MAG: OmpA family protein [Chitinophagales bacterium]